MNSRIFALSIFAALATNIANASVYFDTVDPPAGPSAGYDGPQSDGISVLASSFEAAGTPNFSQIALKLVADNPNDGGSFMVFLVPDTGSGGSAGVAGGPLYSGGSTFTSYTDAALLGTFDDSRLAKASNGSTLLTLNVSNATDAAVAANTHNGEYRVALIPSVNSSVDWLFNADAAGIGTANQAFFNNGDTLGTASDAGNGAYQMLVDTPEPGGLALLGTGLIGIGCLRRRGSRKV